MPVVSDRVKGRLAGAIRRVTRLHPLAWTPRPERPPGAAPVVGLVGFYGHGNYGDELFLEAFREHLEPGLDLRPIIDPGGPRTIARRLGAAVRDSDVILIGGGDIVVPWMNSAPYWERSYLRRPVFVAGVGVPTWRQPESDTVDHLRRFFRHPSVRSIGTRDPESSAWIVAHLGPRAPVLTAPDLVCGLSWPQATRPAGEPIFGVAVRSRSDPDDLTHVRRLCERAAAMGFRVRRIVLATGRVRARDLIATEALGMPDTELVSSDDLAVISRAIGECTVLTSMKFHGVVAATMYGVPAIATMPTTKTRNFLRGIGRPDLLAQYSDPDLPDRLREDLAPIDAATRSHLRAGAVAHLEDLRTRIHAVTDLVPSIPAAPD